MILKKVLLVLLVLFIAIQFIRSKKNVSAEISASRIAVLYPVPDDVNAILVKACNDCHSNNTVYPWYNNVQPVTYWLNNHVKDGKRHLNFDEFTIMRVSKQYKRMEDCIDAVKEDEMPLKAYTWIHKNAILTDVEKQTFYNWCTRVRDSIKARYPTDSLISSIKK